MIFRGGNSTGVHFQPAHAGHWRRRPARRCSAAAGAPLVSATDADRFLRGPSRGVRCDAGLVGRPVRDSHRGSRHCCRRDQRTNASSASGRHEIGTAKISGLVEQRLPTGSGMMPRPGTSTLRPLGVRQCARGHGQHDGKSSLSVRSASSARAVIAHR
jgi:hypothetical protein